MTREEYKSQKLGAKIGELNAQIVDLEFIIQYLNEENEKLKIELSKLSEENACLKNAPKKANSKTSKAE